MRARRGQARHALELLLTVETDRCIPWPYAVGNHGYGVIGTNIKITSVHVIACEHRHGPRPEPAFDHETAHSCTDRTCINYRHLRWATRAENQQDRHIHGTYQYGEQNPSAKLTATDVRWARMAVAGGETCATVAQDLGVSPRTIRDVVTGRRWGSVPADEISPITTGRSRT